MSQGRGGATDEFLQSGGRSGDAIDEDNRNALDAEEGSDTTDVLAGVHITEEEKEEFRAIFQLVDEDHGGSISKDELRTLMDTLNINFTEEELDDIMSRVDINQNGEIELDEFFAVMSRRVDCDYTAEEIKNAFRVFETPNLVPSGYVSTQVLQNAFEVYGKELADPEVIAEMLSTVDPEKTGKINFSEYIAMMGTSKDSDATNQSSRKCPSQNK